LRARSTSRRRPGISELVGSLLAIAITITAGAAVFGYINTQAGVSERQYGGAVGGTVNYLQEQFAVVDMSFTSSTQVVLYLYDYGQVVFDPVQVLVYNTAQSTYLSYGASNVVSTAPSSCSVPASTSNENPLIWNPKSSSGLSVGIQSISTVTLTLPACSGASFASGTTYFVKVTGLYGNSVVYYQVKS